jgi:hypothetical protein
VIGSRLMKPCTNGGVASKRWRHFGPGSKFDSSVLGMSLGAYEPEVGAIFGFPLRYPPTSPSEQF